LTSLKEKTLEIAQQSKVRESHFEVELGKKDLQTQMQKTELN